MYPFTKGHLVRRPYVEEPSDVAQYVSNIFPVAEEHLSVVFLNDEGRIPNAKVVLKSDFRFEDLDFRTIYDEAVEQEATSIITVHNSPQKERDMDSIRFLVEMFLKHQTADVKYVDHITLNNGYHSTNEMGWVS